MFLATQGVQNAYHKVNEDFVPKGASRYIVSFRKLSWKGTAGTPRFLRYQSKVYWRIKKVLRLLFISLEYVQY